jgi:hypothetical protein
MIDPRENQEVYQRALAWVGEQITAAERQGLTLDYVGGWHTYKPDPKILERVWRVLYGIPDAMTHLLTSPQESWEQVLLRWLRQRHGDVAGAGETGGRGGEATWGDHGG